MVSIDINSGRSTREHNIEQPAFATNIEATAEIARQLRLRDMAGLVVIDFIDMEQNSHVRKVERAMKEALKNDRARIQVGRISSFGLMEMSRQRLRTGVLEASTKPCPHCEGTGLMRTAASAGLAALRMIEDEATRGRGDRLLLRAGREAAVYVLNKKRTELADIEHRYGVSIEVAIDESLEGARMTVESSGQRPTAPVRPQPVAIAEEPSDDFEPESVDIVEDEDDAEFEAEAPRQRRTPEGEGEVDRQGRKRRRRRRGGRGRRRDGEGDGEPGADRAADEDAASEQGTIEPDSSPMVETPVDAEPAIAETQPIEQPQPKRRRRSRKAGADVESTAEPQAEVTIPEPAPAEAPPAETVEQAAAPTDETPPAKPARKRRTKAAAAAKVDSAETAEPVPVATNPESEAVAPPAANNDAAEAEDDGEPRRGGWWQRTFG